MEKLSPSGLSHAERHTSLAFGDHFSRPVTCAAVSHHTGLKELLG